MWSGRLRTQLAPLAWQFLSTLVCPDSARQTGGIGRTGNKLPGDKTGGSESQTKEEMRKLTQGNNTAFENFIFKPRVTGKISLNVGEQPTYIPLHWLHSQQSSVWMGAASVNCWVSTHQELRKDEVKSVNFLFVQHPLVLPQDQDIFNVRNNCKIFFLPLLFCVHVMLWLCRLFWRRGFTDDDN